nr:hypothetical protein [uncultured Draconibacterium sp.]
MNANGANGLFMGGGLSFLLKQIIAIIFASAWGFIFTLGVLKAINRVVPVKVGRMDEKKGLDLGYHGEVARQ